MIASLVALATLGQWSNAGWSSSPPPAPASWASDPFIRTPLGERFRALPDVRPAPAPSPNVRPLALPDQVFAPLPLPVDVFAPAPPARRIIRIVGQDRPVPNPAPEPGIRRPEAEEALLKRLADVESRVDVLERARAVTKPAVAAPAKAVLCPMGCPNCEVPCKTPGECGHPGCGVGVARPIAVKTWYTLTNEPGTQGFGALNGLGEVVVERRRPVAQPVVTYAAYQQPVTYQQPVIYQEPIYGSSYASPYGSPYGGGFGAGSVCGPGGCGAAGRGIFGGLFR